MTTQDLNAHQVVEWLSGSELRFYATGSNLGMGKVDLAFNPFSVLINEYQYCAWELNIGGSRPTDHLTKTSAYAPPVLKVT
ncbi:hypothetical protein TNCV_4739581 [Trichonephila clavipes]|nr:hypothetical protein TNCV_4739581 [Trichonephila clavipes]